MCTTAAWLSVWETVPYRLLDFDCAGAATENATSTIEIHNGVSRLRTSAKKSAVFCALRTTTSTQDAMALITLFCSYPEGSKKKRRERSVTNNRAVRISKNPLVLLIVNTSTAYDPPSRKQRLPAINRLCISNPTRPTFALANVITRSLVTFVSWLHGSSLNLGVVVGYKLWVRTGRSVFVRFRASAVNNQLFHKSHFWNGKTNPPSPKSRG